jgi:hypothetical protein
VVSASCLRVFLFKLSCVFALAACGGGAVATSDGGMQDDATVVAIDVCGAFTHVGAACPLPSPIRCFPLCQAGGCFCRVSDGGPTWLCVTDLSCTPDCGPLDDACAQNVPGDQDVESSALPAADAASE